jgi:hypothetical protein
MSSFSSKYRWLIAALLVIAWAFIAACPAEAWLYHATRRAVARRILARGLNPLKFKASSRFGKGFYASRRPSTALLEKGKKSSVVRFKESSSLKKSIWDFRKPKPEKIRSKIGNLNFKGKIRKGIIGPKVGRQLGRAASQKGKVIQYKSSKNGWTNIFVPKKLLQDHQRIVKPEKIIR